MAGGRAVPRERQRELPMSADPKSRKNVQNLEQFIRSAPQDSFFFFAVCLLARKPKPYTIPVRLRMKRGGSIRVSGNECRRIATWACRV